MKKLKTMSFISTLSMIMLLASCSTGKHFDIFGSSAENNGSSSYNQQSGSGQSTSSKQSDSTVSNQDSESSTSSSSAIHYEDPLGITPSFSEDGKTVTYGLYPQKNVNDSDLLASLNALDDSAKGSNGWYLYEDAYYAKASASPYSSSYVFDNGTTIESGTTYWFKCEPITWDILQNNGGKYYLLSSVLLDERCYYSKRTNRTINGETIYPNNYEYSDIREWLNGSFYETAFALGNSYIQTTKVDNSPSTIGSYGELNACNDTEDKIFLLSKKDYINSKYGFSTDSAASTTRTCITTDWARARGASYKTDFMGYYWMRSPFGIEEQDSAYYVRYDGDCSYAGNVYITKRVRPAITLNVS